MLPGGHGDRDESVGRVPKWLSRFPLIVLCLVGLYVFSFGPACKLNDRGVLGTPFVATFYEPLTWIADRWTLFDDFLMWYRHLWGALVS